MRRLDRNTTTTMKQVRLRGHCRRVLRWCKIRKCSLRAAWGRRSCHSELSSMKNLDRIITTTRRQVRLHGRCRRVRRCSSLFMYMLYKQQSTNNKQQTTNNKKQTTINNEQQQEQQTTNNKQQTKPNNKQNKKQ